MSHTHHISVYAPEPCAWHTVWFTQHNVYPTTQGVEDTFDKSVELSHTIVDATDPDFDT